VPAPPSFDYAVIRVVPRVDREEFVNAGVILFCSERGFLGARVALDPARVRALFPGADLALIEEHLAVIPRIAAGGEGSGPIGRLSTRERFHWLVAPRSTIIQVSPVHSGVSADPERALDALLERLVRCPSPGTAARSPAPPRSRPPAPAWRGGGGSRRPPPCADPRRRRSR
jgi:hypothetical protein